MAAPRPARKGRRRRVGAIRVEEHVILVRLAADVEGVSQQPPAAATQHHGNLAVESEPGGGTIFTIDLPASQQRPALHERSPLQPPPAAPPRAGSGRLLVMDDEAALRKLLGAVLTKLGYEVETAQDGAEAIAMCKNAKASGRSFDAALLDLTVSGGMGGVEAVCKTEGVGPLPEAHCLQRLLGRASHLELPRVRL